MKMIQIWMPSMVSTTSMLEQWSDTQIREIEAYYTPSVVNSRIFKHSRLTRDDGHA